MDGTVDMGKILAEHGVQADEELPHPYKEQELTSDSALLAITTQAIGAGTWHYCLDKGTLDWDDRMFQIYGITREQFTAAYEAWTNAVHPDDLVHAEAALNDCIAGCNDFDTEFRIVHPNGQTRHLRGLGKTTFNKGVAQYITGINLDITEHKQAEEVLQGNRQKLQLITDNVPAFIAYIDSDLHYRFSNKSYENWLGSSSKDVIGKHVKDVLGDVVYQILKERYALVLSGERVNFVYSLRFSDNKEHYISGTFVPDISDDGEVKGFFALGTDITERKQAEERIRKLAFYDPLTELPNRTLFQDRLRQAMTASGRDGRHGALLLIDLDNFKTLNDTLGHAAGDKLLKSIAHRLKDTLREGDTVSRLGGDEFMVILQGLSTVKQDAAIVAGKVAEKVRLAISQSDSFGSISHHSTASIGVTLFSGDESNIDDLIKWADLAMYKSKSCGRNTVHFFDPAMETTLLKRITLEADLRVAIQENQFLIHYQAQVDNEGRATGAEALVRWLHPEKGMISPADFIPLAEETGQILFVGQWVLEAACAQLAEWATRPEMAHLTISVNVSAKQLMQKDFVDQVLAILNDTGANPERLKLELTESMLVENVEGIIEIMLTLKTKGVRFSLDDFGTGYSSLSYLSRLPLEQLKIDLSFVRDMLTDKNAAAIAKAIVGLGESLDIEVIAEGIETESQQEFLACLGCHRYQGYLFSRPIPVEEFEEFAMKA